MMNPEYTPERLNDFLSLLLKMKEKVKAVLPNDSTRITDESSLLITDIVVELEDGSLANVEVQKIGYNFPGRRCACYSADMLLRQYKRVLWIFGSFLRTIYIIFRKPPIRVWKLKCCRSFF